MVNQLDLLKGWNVKVVDSKEIVSVSVLTYNHEKYINETLHSILNQKTKFKFKIIVSDDHSKDNTRKIIKNFRITL